MPEEAEHQSDQAETCVSRAGCFTRDWQTRLRVSPQVKRICKQSHLNTKALLDLIRKHDEHMPLLLPVGRRVQTSLEWAGSRDTLVATSICHPTTGDVLTLVQFSWEGKGG